MAKHIVPIMKQQQRSCSIINLASGSGMIAIQRSVPYSATKAAIIQMSKNLALDLGAYNIRVNSISPGPIGTAALNCEIEFKLEFICSAILLFNVYMHLQLCLFRITDDGSFGSNKECAEGKGARNLCNKMFATFRPSARNSQYGCLFSIRLM